MSGKRVYNIKRTWDLQKYSEESAVTGYFAKKEPLITAIPFENNASVLMSLLDDSFEYHILLQHFGITPYYKDRYYRIVDDTESAEWTFVCPL